MHQSESEGRKSGGFKTDEELPALHIVFQGVVASVQKYGVFVNIPGYKRHGLVHVSQMSSARIEDPGEMLAKGEKVYCKVISVETEGSKIGLSMKLVNQTTGQDLDPNNVQLSQDEKKRKRFFAGDRPPIELGAVYDTKCRNCGGHGHLALECFVGKGGKQYALLPELEDMVPSESEIAAPPSSMEASQPKKKKKKKEKKQKKEKKRKKQRQHSDSADSDDEPAVKRKKRRHHHRHQSDSSASDDSDDRTARKKKKQRHHSESSDSDSPTKNKKHRRGSHQHKHRS